MNLILSPLSSRATIEFGALSPDGRCYAWDERANGHVRGEGGGIVVLKRLQDAQAAGDRIYGVIRGSGLSTGEWRERAHRAQRRRAARRDRCRARPRARECTDDVQYVELHGTGTPVGDPIEARAIAAAYGRDRTDARWPSARSRRTSATSRARPASPGLIKTALCVYHGQLVASLNFERPNPEIALDELNLRVAQATEAWAGAPRRGRRVRRSAWAARTATWCSSSRRRSSVPEKAERAGAGAALRARPRRVCVDQARRLRAFVADARAGPRRPRLLARHRARPPAASARRSWPTTLAGS